MRSFIKSTLDFQRNSLSLLFVLALISVTAKPSPLITIAAGGAPTRSEIRVSSSPITNQSTLREIRISRPDSPSISINRTGTHQNVNNGSTGAFHISVEAPTNLTTRRQTPPVC